MNGSTHTDHTVVHRGACRRTSLEVALFGEADRMHRDRADGGEPEEPGRRGEGRDQRQRAQPALRRVPVAAPAADDVRHVPERTRRLRIVRGPRGRDRRRRRASSSATTRRATPCCRSPATSIRTRSHDARRAPLLACPEAHGRRSISTSASPLPTAERRGSVVDRERTAARDRARLPRAAPVRRVPRLHRDCRAGFGARRRAGVASVSSVS